MDEKFMRLLTKGNCSKYSRETGDDVWQWYQATPFDGDLVARALLLCDDCEIKKECLLANYENDAIIAGGQTQYDRKIKRWKRVNSVGQTNWRRTSTVVRDLFREEE